MCLTSCLVERYRTHCECDPHMRVLYLGYFSGLDIQYADGLQMTKNPKNSNHEPNRTHRFVS